MAHSSISNFKAYFQQRKSAVMLPPDTSSEHRAAAVLILIYPGLNELEIILTKRSENLPHHAGQISLPGGTVDASDQNSIHTALREAQEEVGLNSKSVDVLGTMEEVTLPSGFVVTPVVAVMEQAPVLLAEPAEVAEIFSLPLQMALDKDLYKQDTMIRNGIKRRFYFFDYKGYYIWGATASILRSLAFSL